MTNLETFSPSNPGPLYLKSGELSRYGLACGYIETRWAAPDCLVTLFREGDRYHVQIAVFAGVLPPDKTTWKTFTRLADARREHRHLVRELTT